MRNNLSKLTSVAASVAILAAVSTLPAAAAVRHGHAHRTHRHVAAHALTVHRAPVAVATAPDPYTGPAAIITAPVAAAGFIVGLPFRAIGALFPPNANDPRIIVGAPVYVAGRIAQFPFYAIDSVFGAPPNYY